MGMKKDKAFKHFYVTQGMKDCIEEIITEKDWKKAYLVKKAIELFLSGEQKIKPNFLITKRTDPDYVKRDVMEQAFIEVEQLNKIQDVATKYGCKYSVVLFQVLYDYCLLIKSVE